MLYDCNISAMNFAGKRMKDTRLGSLSQKALQSLNITNMVLFPTNTVAHYCTPKIEKKNMARISHILFDRSGNTVFFECKGEHAHVLSV